MLWKMKRIYIALLVLLSAAMISASAAAQERK